jgi:hypothetical protein
VNTKIRKPIERRLDKNDNRGCDRPIMTAANIHYEIADRTRATANGGIGAMHLLMRQLGLDQAIDVHLGLLKIHLPYHDSDHVLNIAYNLLAGGTCLQHLELLRSDEAYLDADCTMAETSGECKQGMDINHKGQWGYHPLLLSLANTGELLFVVNRSGNRPSHEQAAYYFDRSIARCCRAGFQKIRLRGDTDFTQSEHLDRWDAE